MADRLVYTRSVEYSPPFRNHLHVYHICSAKSDRWKKLSTFINRPLIKVIGGTCSCEKMKTTSRVFHTKPQPRFPPLIPTPLGREGATGHRRGSAGSPPVGDVRRIAIGQ
ncbi:uncharacterized protein LOC143522124 isoform X1 [Brachyhypopomus gauderio]|uniref:uncharacterized protein LOC143522124 isoform X1 n=1 Tax=Brachyhypopomus gauderio TaxID=698409 RepID=UPI0040422EBA